MIRQKNYVQPYIPMNTQTPYVGAELQELTTDTPFYRAQGIPVYSGYGAVTRQIHFGGAYGAIQGLSYDANKAGTVNPDVKELQNKLVAAGYTVGSTGVDGKFGSQTLNALNLFQAAKGITGEEGVVGPKTAAALNGTTSKDSKDDKDGSRGQNFLSFLDTGFSSFLDTQQELAPQAAPITITQEPTFWDSLGTGGKIAVGAGVAIFGLVAIGMITRK
jgi:hypothetical protein